MKHASHPEIIKRLKQASGHLTSVIAMIEAGRSCVELAQQLQAVENAIHTAKRTLVQDHMEHSLADAVAEGETARNRALTEFKIFGEVPVSNASTFDKIRHWFGFGSADHDHAAHGHHHAHGGGHGHTHGVVDASLATSERGIWAIKWSFVILAITAALQMIVVIASHSVALLADTIHNIGDATTAIPLWIAFILARRKPSKRFTYGLGKVEDFAGLLIVLIILFSALVAGYEAINRFFHPQPIGILAWVAAAGVIGFFGNEIVAVFRIRVGREMNSAALIADGYHARVDGLTSLAVVVGALGVYLGFPLADPIVGLLITIAIFGIVWQSSKAVLTRMFDGVGPSVIDEIRHAVEHVPGISRVPEVKARWLGHQLHADVTIALPGNSTIADGSRIADVVKSELFAHLPALADARVRLEDAEGRAHEHSKPHSHAHTSHGHAH